MKATGDNKRLGGKREVGMNRRLFRGMLFALAGGAMVVATMAAGLPLSALAAEQVEQSTTATRGSDGPIPGYWVTVTERVFDWEEQKFINVVAYYRPYRDRWLDALSRSSFEVAGGRHDNWWQGVNEDKVLSAVQKVGWSNVYNYVKNQTNADWQNHGVVLIDPETNTIVGHLAVDNSYDASAKIAAMLNKEAVVATSKGNLNLYLSATSVLSSPIVLDLHGLGKPDLLAGPTWNVIPGRKIASTALRTFDLDGSGEYAWEWVGPKSGLLAWDGDGKGNIASGTQLFGNNTWGKKWKDGYEALATLDDNNDGQVTSNEFGNLVVWIDTNSNGVSDKGEVKSLTELGIEKINVKAQRDAKGNAWAKAGFVRKMPGGERKTLTTWDWIAMGEARQAEGTYVWVGDDGERKLGGYFKLNDAAGSIRGYSVPTIGVNAMPGGLLAAFPVTGKRSGEKIKWSVPADGGTVTSEVEVDNGGKHLYGKTRVDTNKEKFEYLWQAELVAGDPIGPKARSARN